MWFLNKYDIINETQCGFQKGLSIQNTKLSVMDYICTIRGVADKYDGITLNFAKAFDIVHRQRLLYKLDDVGIRSIALKHFKPT